MKRHKKCTLYYTYSCNKHWEESIEITTTKSGIRDESLKKTLQFVKKNPNCFSVVCLFLLQSTSPLKSIKVWKCSTSIEIPLLEMQQSRTSKTTAR